MMTTPRTSNDSGQLAPKARPAPPQAPRGLFLDIDGTLLDIAPTPDAVNVDAELLNLLRRLERACDGALALITGRPIAAVDALIEAFMQEEPFSGRTPVFIGDDTTDLDGFAAMKRFNVLAIAVGSRIPGERRLAGPRDVRAWPESLLVS